MNLETLKQYEKNGLLISNSHNTLPLTIWNYTNKVQFEDLWDDITLQCRGLVTDDEGNVVARPFKKFFNIEENKHTPTDKFEVFEKLDGSLGIVFFYNGEWHVATRGSFHSEQAIRAKEMLYDNVLYGFMNEKYTYLVEIIYPKNRIVVDYEGLSCLSHLATISRDKGFETIMNNPFIQSCKRYDSITDYNKLKSLNWRNCEGFVVKFSNGDRCKIKFEDYLRLHKIVTGTNTHHVWEHLKDGRPINELIENVPDEFYNWVKGVVYDLETKFYFLLEEYVGIYKSIPHLYGNKKEFALEALKHEHHSLLFGQLNGKDITPMIWKIIKPKTKEKAFSI